MLLDAGGFPGSELLHLCGIAWSIHVYVVVEEQEDLGFDDEFKDMGLFDDGGGFDDDDDDY